MSILWELPYYQAPVQGRIHRWGACIVSPDNKILSMGYNGFPMGCSDDEFPWSEKGIRYTPNILRNPQ